MWTAADQTRIDVWLKGRRIPGEDPTLWRQDDAGNRIYFHDYGRRDSERGWEIDHIQPVHLGGSDRVANLRPLHWRANSARQYHELARILAGPTTRPGARCRVQPAPDPAVAWLALALIVTHRGGAALSYEHSAVHARLLN